MGAGGMCPQQKKCAYQSIAIAELRAINIGTMQDSEGKAGPPGLLPTEGKVPTLRVGPHFGQFRGEAEAMLRGPMAKDHCGGGHEVQEMFQALHVPRPCIRGHPPFRGAVPVRVCRHQG